jgi:Predicted glycosyltransferases
MINKISKAFAILRSEGFFKGIKLILQKLLVKASLYFSPPYEKYISPPYEKYIEQEIVYTKSLRNDIGLLLNNLSYKPTFSVVMPVYNVDEKWLRKAIESVRQQIYPYWELCIADDASSLPHIKAILDEYRQMDDRIKVIFRDENGGIAAASNSAIEIANGDYLAFLDHDDELAPHALYENAKLINQHPEADYIYSDEDKIDVAQNRFDHHFKPDWSPDLLYSINYTCHLGVYRTSLVKKIGGFRSEYDGSQDYDLTLRITDETKNILHIPKVLYHWRTLPASTASSASAKEYAFTAAKNALQDRLCRKGIKGKVEFTSNYGLYHTQYQIVGMPKVSIIIPTAGKPLDQTGVTALENCVTSIVTITGYKNWEIIIVDGYDIPKETLNRLEKITDKFTLISSNNEFNFSQRINLGATIAQGEHLLLLNDDTQVINVEWLESLLQLSQLSEIGAVGAKLFYPNGTLQHIGVILPNPNLANFSHIFYGYEDKCYYFYNGVAIRNYLAVTGACLMVKRQLFEAVGGLTEELPLNYNDVDFCLKLHKLGYRNVFTPYARLYHYEYLTRKAIVQEYEIEYMKNHWIDYINSLGGYDPYYNPNFSTSNCIL